MKVGFVEPHLEAYKAIRRLIELANRLLEGSRGVTVFHSNGSPYNYL